MSDASEMRAARRTTWLLLAAALFIGLAHIAFLPPWEGFDETAHWSYLQELADTGHPPRYGVDDLSRDLTLYPGPMPYGGSAPFDWTGRPTYRSYRENGAARLIGGPSRYAQGEERNWQAQHPPLYYLLAAPVYRWAHGLGWVDHLAVLRVFSYALAWLGLAIGVLATARRAGPAGARIGVWALPIMAAWPFLFPEFFPEFARLGNDSLCLLLVGSAWAFLLTLQEEEKGGWGAAAALGVVLGLGLLTKAFFLAITVGVGLWLLVRWWVKGRHGSMFAQSVLAMAGAVALGGWWYIAKLMETGSLVGSDEFIHLRHAGGFAAIVDGYSSAELIRGLLVMPATFVWAGTWSLARLPEVFLLGPAVLLVWTLVAYGRRLFSLGLLGWAPLAFAAPMVFGLVYHVFTWMAGTSAVTPGWYLHILAAPLGLAVAFGWNRPRLLGGLAAYTGIYSLVAWAFQLSLFSGCAAKLGADKHYTLQGAKCFIDFHALSQIAHPGVGAAALITGVLLASIAAACAWRAYQPATTRDKKNPPSAVKHLEGMVS